MKLKKAPFVGIMVLKRRFRKHVLKFYQQYNDLDIQLFCFTPSDILWNKQIITGLFIHNGKCREEEFPFPKAVYNRCYNISEDTFSRVTKAVGPVRCFNSINHFNKWDVHKLLTDSPVSPYLPETFLFRSDGIEEALSKFKVLYIKPVYGFKGNEVYRLELRDNGQTSISLHHMNPFSICRNKADIQDHVSGLVNNGTYIVQQGIGLSKLDSRLFDIRVVVQKTAQGIWEVSTALTRIAHENYYNTSMSASICATTDVLTRLYPEEKVKAVFHELNEISICSAMTAEERFGHLGEVSVDFVIDDSDKLWILEMNGKPQKTTVPDQFREKVIKRPLEYALFLTRQI
ncbi:hypothetical protein CR205_14750 [Alteribacter lacisalsi]|uniref:ATP-grasp domain-containing protein n=1 Tax=Alteribacter lacisalsi TaxID=2045244 RepID=A0A2W0HA59_9BACI|nr:YheC/YheD family protein [Alteribacter lacisalsi]PYZ96930.1 hypothetical protein CR205_14750 [Alteribacter lacisalsi]